MQTYPCYECGEKDKRIAELEGLVSAANMSDNALVHEVIAAKGLLIIERDKHTALVDGLRELADDWDERLAWGFAFCANDIRALLGKESKDG